MISGDDVLSSPPSLIELRPFLSRETYEWLCQHEEKAGTEDDDDDHSNEHEEVDEACCAAALFGGGGGEDQDDDEEDEAVSRVYGWTSSLTSPDGIGGYDSPGAPAPSSADSAESTASSSSSIVPIIKVHYVLSDSGGGHGDDVWAASRHIANIMADPDKCQELLMLEDKETTGKHPLQGLTFIELGAGAGIPSWTAFKAGCSYVVCTDQNIPNRIRCLAECAKLNYDDGTSQEKWFHHPNNNNNNNARLQRQEVKVCPYNWGESVTDSVMMMKLEASVGTGNEDNDALSSKYPIKFDVVVAADCIYMPECHEILLDSFKILLKSGTGIGLLPFALHGNTSDESVWEIVDKAKSKGFVADVLKSQQLTPQIHNMNPKRGLVHMVRLSSLP